MIKGIPSTELDQWAVLKTAIDAGSFAKAALKLNRSQSSISYAIGKLEERLGVELLTLHGRRAVLTEAGRLLLAEATPLIDEFRRLEARAHLMADGQEPRIRLLIDAIAPKHVVFSALSQFRQRHGGVEVVLREVVRQSPANLQTSDYDLAISLWEDRVPNMVRFLDVDMVAVAAPGHPLLSTGAILTAAALAHHPIVFIDHDGDRPGRPVGSGRHLRVNSLDCAVEAVRSGFCHGRLPRHLIADDLKSGRIVQLPIADSIRVIPLVLAYSNADLAGPLTRIMADLLKQEGDLYRQKGG